MKDRDKELNKIIHKWIKSIDSTKTIKNDMSDPVGWLYCEISELLNDTFNEGYMIARKEEIKFLKSLDIDDMDEITMQVNGEEVYLDDYLRNRINKLKDKKK